jgi:hypothetical protein
MKQIATWASFVSLSLLQLACTAGDPSAPVASDESAIIGGTNVTAGQFPSVVAIRPTLNTLCTGALIAPDLVLTAAHCVSAMVLGLSNQDQVASGMTVVLDTQNALVGGRSIRVLKATPMPEFTAPGQPDLGVIRLAEKVTDRAFIPVNLDGGKAPVGTTLTIVGYGLSNASNNSSAGIEKTIDKPSISCGVFGVSDDTFTCVDQTGGGICEGDSGGPAFAMIDGVLKQVSVNSVGAQGCTIASALMRTSAGKAFLLANAGDAFCLADSSCNAACGQGGLPADPDCDPCNSNDDCASDEVCSQHTCIPGPDVPGGAGSTCTTGADCPAGSWCGESGGEHRCTSACDPNASTCPDGFQCNADTSGGGACWPGSGATGGGGDKDGGCSVAAGGAGRTGAAGSLAFVMVLAGLVAVRRRRRA